VPVPAVMRSRFIRRQGPQNETRREKERATPDEKGPTPTLNPPPLGAASSLAAKAAAKAASAAVVSSIRRPSEAEQQAQQPGPLAGQDTAQRRAAAPVYAAPGAASSTGLSFSVPADSQLISLGQQWPHGLKGRHAGVEHTDPRHRCVHGMRQQL